jgi:RNA polymerase-binding transcription factor DksA
MDPADLRQFHRLLLKKQSELSSALGEAQSRVPAAGGLEGDLIDQANADEEAELQIRLHQTEGCLARAIEEALVRIKKCTYGVRSVRTSHFKSPVERRSLGTPLP